MIDYDHGGDIKGAAQKYGFDQQEIIDFSANINFLGPPNSVKEVIKNNIEGIINYPDYNCSELKNNLIKDLRITEPNLIIGNGAVELIYLLAKVLQPNRGLVLAPTFSEYGSALESVGGVVEELYLKREEDFKLSLSDILNKLADVDLFFLCNPNNPTAKFIGRDKVIKILDEAQQKKTFVVVDEAFVDFLAEDITVIDLVNEYNNLFVLRSLTKFFAIPGLRLGYGATNPDLISKLEASKDPWNVNFFAQQAGKVAINDQKYIQRTKQAINQEKKFLYNQLKQLNNLKVYYPHANYIFIDISKTNFTSSQLEEKLAQQGILIRNCNTYSNLNRDFIRIAVKSRKDNLKLLTEIKKLV